ncbi:helix-turn-helix transcriptional regulator [Haloarcula sp. Atlit-120R]|uniref:helix-turn-helix transcriptional regulator n=1 Tax=Haloarcula sp. Atlit-120R TaxID=2282135 RepID=UPI0018F2A956|nr:helix-turn-helix transcriptional regulator [Haloarcula sp. Atlit-120R]
MSSKKNEGSGGTLNELFEILSHEYRRRILLAVAQQNPQDEDDITSEAVAEEHGDDGDALEHVKTGLHHVHLPKLADAGFIDWDRDSGTITRGPRLEEIEPLLKLMHDHQDELPEDWP